MMECKYCKYYNYERDIYFYTNGPRLTLGTCNYDNRGFGNKTTSINYCENFAKRSNLYHKGDVLKKPRKRSIIYKLNKYEDYYRGNTELQIINLPHIHK